MSFFRSRRFLSFFYFLFIAFSLEGNEVEYSEPKEVATTEGLPSSIVGGSVCAITGEYVDSVVDVVIPGPEPLTLSRVYTSFSNQKPWSFNHHDHIVLSSVRYKNDPSYLITLHQPSGTKLDYVFKKGEDDRKLDRAKFKFVTPQGLTNGATLLSGKTNIRNQSVTYFDKKREVICRSGAGNRKIFKELGERDEEGWPYYTQVLEEKVNGSRLRYKVNGRGKNSVKEIICENGGTKQFYSSLTLLTEEEDGTYCQTVKTSDNRKLHYFFKKHHYHVREEGKDSERSELIKRSYLTKVEHPYAPPVRYDYSEKNSSRDKHITSKSRNKGKEFLNIHYYHPGVNHVGGAVGNVTLDNGDYRIDRVKSLEAPVGANKVPITTHRFEYHASTEERHGIKRVTHGYTDVYDAENHKTRYKYDEKHRLISITRYTGTDDHSYTPHSKESFIWDEEG